MSDDTNNSDKVPLFKTWKGWYRALVLFLILQIAMYYALTIYFS